MDNLCNEIAYESAFRQYAKELRQFMYIKTGSIQRSEDIVQDAFIKLWKNCKKVTNESVRGFLYKVCKNQFLNEVKHQQVVLKYQAHVANPSTSQDPEFLMMEKEYHEKLIHAIQSLPEKQRTVFLLNRIEKKTYKEIASDLELSVKAIEKRMHLALKTIREKIEGFK